MTDVKVVDASALAAVLFGEAEAESIMARFADARLVAPTLLPFELANVCLVKCRRNPEQVQSLVTMFGLSREMDLEELPVDAAGVLDLALDARLTAYDASYLWLARQLKAELVTLDKALERAAAAL